jgi:thiamine-phosphate pyrophosphorylase
MFAIPRFYPILDTGILSHKGMEPSAAAAQILEGGAQILQFRHKGFYSRDTIAELERVALFCAAARVPLVVNDRADLAVLFHAALHLGQHDLPPIAARKVTGPDAYIGFSTHNETQLREAMTEPVNYLALGPIFGTSSKENPDPTVGLDELRRLRPLTKLPLVAIGGITLENALSVLEAGADSVAVIGDLFSGVDIRARTEEWMRRTS